MRISYYEKIGYDVIKTFIDDETLPDMLETLFGREDDCSCRTVGRWEIDIIEYFDSELELKTGVISEALGRGKHTTRHVELIEVAGGLVADTPGFSSLDFDHIEKEELPLLLR